MNRGGERATVINDPARPADNKHETLPTRLSMKALKYIIVTSLLIVAFKFLLALNATMNGSYHASEVSRMVPFLFILALAAALYLVVFAIRKVFPTRATSAMSTTDTNSTTSRGSEVAEAAKFDASALPPDAAQVALGRANVKTPDVTAPAPQTDVQNGVHGGVHGGVQGGEAAEGRPDSAMLRFFPNHAGKAASIPAVQPIGAGAAGTPAAPANTMLRFFPQHVDRAVAVPAIGGVLGDTQRALNPAPLASPAAGPETRAPHAAAPDEMGAEPGSQDHAARADLAEPARGATSDVDAREQSEQAPQFRQEIRRLDMTDDTAQRAAGLGRLRWLVAAPLGLLGTLFLIAGSDGGSLLLGGFGGLMLVPAVLKGCGVK